MYIYIFSLAKNLGITLNALANWSPLIGEVPYMPAFIFPFVKLFGSDSLAAFETVVTILLSWCSDWFQTFPNPPIPLLNHVEALLSFHDPKLLEHLVDLGVSTQDYSWNLLQSLFTEVMQFICIFIRYMYI